MAASVSNPADVVNIALRRIGYKLRVGQLYDGSDASNNALDIYAQTRDALLREGNFGFAQKTAAGAASVTPPTAPWSFAFTYPADCLRVRNLFPSSYTATDQSNPLRVLFLIADATASTKYILTNEQTPVIVYTAQVTDPTVWDPLFVDAFANMLGKQLAPILTGLDAVKLTMEDGKTSLPLAEGIIG